MQRALECNNLSKSFGATVALKEVSLTIETGSLTALLGPSGCGKTTLLRLIAGFERPDTGTIHINGRLMASEQVMVPAEQRRVGMVFQEYALFQHLNVAQNIAFGLKGSAAEKQARIQEMLHLIGLEGFDQRMPHELSGGQQQRIALARALAPRPEILLLDEPFSNLDAALRSQVRTEVKAILRASQITAVFVTHDQEEALSLADQVAVMSAGKILQVAPPKTLYHYPAHRDVATFVGESHFLPAQAAGNTATCELGTVALQQSLHGPVELMVRPETFTLRPAENGSGNAVIEWREFYGHDQRVGVHLNTGRQLTVRLGPDADFRPGQTVLLTLEQPVVAYPTGRHEISAP
ncbi:MAG: ABC transporter ATP-binding protein [Anaerolineae bacterium]